MKNRRGGDERDSLMNRGSEYDDLTAIGESQAGTRDPRVLDPESHAAPTKRRFAVEDKEYEGEIGYSLVQALRGKNVGRRFKRNLFKLALVQLICGISLLVISSLTDFFFSSLSYFDSPHAGAQLQMLSTTVSLWCLILGIITAMVFRSWGSMVTNRDLLVATAKIYLLIMWILLALNIWLIVCWTETFKGIDWESSPVLTNIEPYYNASLAFLFPLMFFSLYYLQNLHQLVNEVGNEGDITEPDVDPEEIVDLSDISLMQACVYIFAFPCIIMIQCWDLLAATRRAYIRHYRDFFPEKKKTKRRGICARLCRTFARIARECITGRKNVVLPVAAPDPREGLQTLADQNADREARERVEREWAAQQAEIEELRRKEQAEEEARASAERARLEQERLEAEAAAAAAAEAASSEEKARLRAEAEAAEALRLAQEENERLRKEMEEAAAKEADVKSALTLSVGQFKTLWSELGTAGSFQAKLKLLPQAADMTAHLKKQGFHIVFVATPSPTDLEIGLCNTRVKGSEKWFMARFLATSSTFSAVMKAEDSTQVTMYVKKFALAKVLKITK